MDKNHTFNNQIDFELRNKEMLVNSIKQLEEQKVVLLKNNERYDTVQIEIQNKLKERSKQIESLKAQQTDLSKEL